MTFDSKVDQLLFLLWISSQSQLGAFIGQNCMGLGLNEARDKTWIEGKLCGWCDKWLIHDVWLKYFLFAFDSLMFDYI